MKDKKEHRRRVVKRRTRRPQTAPGRLGWLGGGMASSSASTSMGNDNQNNIHIDDGNTMIVIMMQTLKALAVKNY